MRTLVFTVLLAAAAPRLAHAESWENVAGAEFLTVFPQLRAESSTAFAAVGFGGRGFYAFGVAQDFYAVTRFSVSRDSGYVPGVTRTGDHGTLTGDLAFNGEAYRAELGAKWKFITGFNLAPYLEAYAGYQWTTFRNQDLRNSRGASFGLSLSDEGRGALTTAAGLSLEYRLFNLALVSASCLYARVWDDIYRGDLTLGLSAAISWF